jgi:dimethylargininase
MSRLIALTREVSPSIVLCQLTHLARQAIDVDLARAQHASYECALEQFGCVVQRLRSVDDMPDSVFIEDTAVVVDDIAIIARPGAASRRREIAEVAAALSPHRSLVPIVDPGTIDGGDVLIVGHQVFIGRTNRTNDDGIVQARAALAPFGYVVTPAVVRGCLHLKSAITALDDQTLLVNRRWIDETQFSGFELIDVDPIEPAGANIARAGGGLLYASSFPRTLERLQRRGYRISAIDVSEIAKAEGAVTCCSLIFSDKSS